MNIDDSIIPFLLEVSQNKEEYISGNKNPLKFDDILNVAKKALIIGERGSGKTTFLNRFTTHAKNLGYRNLHINLKNFVDDPEKLKDFLDKQTSYALSEDEDDTFTKPVFIIDDLIEFRDEKLIEKVFFHLTSPQVVFFYVSITPKFLEEFSRYIPDSEISFITIKNKISTGNYGDVVEELQNLLNKVGRRLTVDSIFGRITDLAVKKFQEQHGLVVDGIVGPQTWNILNDEVRKIWKSKPDAIELDHGLATFVNDGNFKETDDQLDFSNDIDAIANLLSYKKVHPPIAIGLFGNWGSGKSFFMSKLEDKINDYAASTYDTYCNDVVHVKFNSWHYSDANLWASLVTEIFDTLHKYAKKKGETEEKNIGKLLYEDINTSKELISSAKLQLLKIQGEKELLEGQIQKIVELKKEKAKSYKGISFKDAINAVFKDPSIKEELSNLKDNYLTNEIESLEEIRNSVDELKSTWKKWRVTLNEYKLFSWRKLGILIGIPLSVLIIIFLVKRFLIEFDQPIEKIITIVTVVLTFAQQFFQKAKPIFNKIDNGFNRLLEVKKRIDTVAEQQIQKQGENEIIIQDEIHQLTIQEQELAQKVNETTRLIRNKEIEIEEIRSGKRLAKFIEERSGSELYKQQLGIISWIRKDFEQLDKELFRQKALEGKIKNENDFKIDRIVLYIDDLDRCPEPRVVEVLGAIHLILAFKLFAVVVGVDPRWVSHALSNQYSHLYLVENSEKGEKRFGHATTCDFLEKIFQIPFALRKIEDKTRKRLIDSIIKQGKEKSSETKVHEDKKLKLFTPTGTSGKVSASRSNLKASSHGSSSITGKLSAIPRPLELNKDEIAFMKKISRLIGSTPRTIKRYINVYLIIRSHDGVKISDKNEMMALMLTLAIIIGQPLNAREFVSTLVKRKRGNIGNLINQVNFPKEVIDLFETSDFSDINELKISDLKKNLEMVSRFSFRLLN